MTGWVIFAAILASPYVAYKLYVKLPQGYRLHVKLMNKNNYEPYRWTLVRESNADGKMDEVVATGDAEFIIWVKLIAARRARQNRKYR